MVWIQNFNAGALLIYRASFLSPKLSLDWCRKYKLEAHYIITEGHVLITEEIAFIGPKLIFPIFFENSGKVEVEVNWAG